MAEQTDARSSRPMVIMASEQGREALRMCGVLPPSAFRTIDESVGSGCREPGFFVWPHEPDYACKSAGFGDYPLISMLGMELPKDNAEYLTRKIEAVRLFGATLIHVILLDDFDPKAKPAGKPPLCSIAAVTTWCDQLRTVVQSQYSDEQADDIEHVFVLVARDLRGLRVNADEVTRFCARLNGSAGDANSTDAKIQSCFFLDWHLEIEQGNDLFPSGYVWPQMVGRLLLRMLIAAEEEPNRPMGWCSGGIRLWKAAEFVLDFPPEKIHELMSVGIGKFIKQLKSLGGGDAELSLSPWSPSAHRAFQQVPVWLHRATSGDWNKFDPKSCVQETFDASMWRKELAATTGSALSNPNRDEDVDRQRFSLTSAIHSSLPAIDSVVSAVSDWSRDASAEVGGHFKPTSKDDLVSCWSEIVKQGIRRANCQDVLEKATGEYELAKSHYVRWKRQIAAAMAISVAAGLVFCRLVLSVGGDIVLAGVLCAGTLVGGLLTAWLTVRAHDGAGAEGRAEILRLCKIADDCVVSRDKEACQQVSVAVKMNSRMRQLAKMGYFKRLVGRLQRMFADELVTPAAEVFVEDDLPEVEPDPSAESDLRARIIQFFDRTNYRIRVDESDCQSVTARENYQKECLRVAQAWTRLCADRDQNCRANFQACYFLPFLKGVLADFRRSYGPEVRKDLAAASLGGALERIVTADGSRGGVNEIKNFVRRFASDDAYYSAHVDLENKHDVTGGAQVFYSPLLDDAKWGQLRDQWKMGLVSGLGNVKPSNVLLAQTPHFAFIFASCRISFGTRDEKLILEFANQGKESDDG